MDRPLTLSGFWLRLAALVLLTVPPLWVGLGDADCQFHMEVRAVASSQETWMRLADDAQAWRVPSWNGQPRINKPPLVVWMNLLAWAGLPADAPVDVLVYRARLLAAALGWLTLLGVLWMGRTLVNTRFGFAAAVVTGTNLFFLRNVRLATYDTYLLAFCTLSMAAALWALQPQGTRASRHRWGWALAGIFLAAGLLSKGPMALLLGGAPMILLCALQPAGRRSWRGLAGALGLALAMTLPWYVYVWHTVPDAVALWRTEFSAERDHGQPPWYYLGLLGLVFPWTLWLVAGLLHRGRADPRLRPALLWFIWIFVVLSLPGAKQQRYILPILPAVGLLVAGVLLQPAPFRVWTRLHTALLLGAAVVVSGLGFLPEPWLTRAGFDYPAHLGWPAAWSLGPGLLLFVLALKAGYVARAGWNERALWITAVGLVVAATPALHLYAQGGRSQYPQRSEIEQVAALTRDQPLYYLDGPFTEPQYIHPDPRFRLYARRVPPGRTLDQLRALPGPAWLTVPDQAKVDRELRRVGWQPDLTYRDKGPLRRLYFKPAP
jgi:4-amino-4-deoxy-L-arabinose transferase-like glycosyltransferase